MLVVAATDMPLFGPDLSPEQMLALRDVFRMRGVGEENAFRRYVRTWRINQLNQQLSQFGIPENYTLQDMFSPRYDTTEFLNFARDYQRAEGETLRGIIQATEMERERRALGLRLRELLQRGATPETVEQFLPIRGQLM